RSQWRPGSDTRNELSMTKPGETFYRLVPDASKRAATAGQTHR
ncbi:hypothetical protein LTSEINV_4361, partial [Salmonella enterica subsp. enterica serovar Inverness str. R8-3668]